MTFTSHPLRARVTAVLAALMLVVALVTVIGARAAGSAALPEVSADELIGSVAQVLADAPPVSGELQGTVELGLPDEALTGGGGSVTDLAGDHRLRIWKSGEELRIAKLGRASERTFITDGTQAWTWDSRTMEATHRDLPERQAGQIDGFLRGLTSGDPAELGGRALAAVDDTTDVSVQGSAVVAGRDAYRLAIEPRTEETLVGRIEVDIDAEQRLPLRAAVYGRDATEPSLETAFTSVSFEPIDPETFTFSPPPGAEVREIPEKGLRAATPGPPGHEQGMRAPDMRAPEDGSRGDHAPDHADRVRTIGEGWSAVVALRQDGPPMADAEDDLGVPAGFEQFLPFTGPLFSARAEQIDDQRWLLIGAVDQDTLEQAAQALR